MTLADSRESIAESLAVATNLCFGDQKVLQKMPIGRFTLKQIAAQIRVTDEIKFSNCFKEHYLNFGYKKTHCVPNVIESLKILKLQNVELVLISAKTIETLLPSLRHLNLTDFFSKVISVSIDGDKTTAMRETNVMAYIGDTQSDIDAANEVGAHSIHFDGINSNSVEKFGHQFSDFADLPLLIEQLITQVD